MERHQKRVAALRAAVFESPGRLAPDLRRAIGSGHDVPEPLRAYVDKVHRHAYKVTDDEVEALKQTYSQDQLFEITISAAVGAGLSRLERGLAALGKGK
jgi:hypothetical protein